MLRQLQAVHEVQHQVVDLMDCSILELVKVHVFFGLVRKVVHARGLQIFGGFQLNVLIPQQLSELLINFLRTFLLLVKD